MLDEPLGALDLKLRREMQIELKEIQREVGITFVFVTHDQEEALTMSDRIAVFNEGRIEQLASPVELYEHPASAFVAGFVGTSNLLQGDVARQLLGAEGTFVIRPEKVSMTAPDAAPAAGDGTCVARGVVREVVVPRRDHALGGRARRRGHPHRVAPERRSNHRRRARAPRPPGRPGVAARQPGPPGRRSADPAHHDSGPLRRRHDDENRHEERRSGRCLAAGPRDRMRHQLRQHLELEQQRGFRPRTCR